MKLYIISVAGAAVISAVVNMMSPEKWTKYIGIVTGLVVAMCIGRPIFAIMHTDVFSGIEFEPSALAEDGKSQFYNELKSELERRIEEDIKSRLKNEFGTDCEAETEVDMDFAGSISGVRSITVYGRNIDNAAVGRLREVYGAGTVIISGDKKISKKTE